MEAFDLAERLQTPVFVMTDLDLGMNTWMADAVPLSRTSRSTAASGSTPTTLQELGDWGRYRDVDGDGIAVAHGARRRPARVLQPRLRPQRPRASTASAPDDYTANVDRLARKFETARRLVPRGGRRRSSPAPTSASSPTARATGRSRGSPRPAQARGRPRRRRTCGCARTRSPTEVERFIDRHDARLRGRAEPRRADAQPAEAGPRRRARSASCGASCTTTGCRSTRGRSPTRSWPRNATPGSGPNMTTPTTQPRPGGGEEGEPDRPRDRGVPRRQDARSAPAAATTRSRSASSRRSSRWASTRAGHQAVGHRLLEQEPGVLPRAVARLQLGARPHAGRGDRRRAGEQAPAGRSASAATATPARSARASSST